VDEEVKPKGSIEPPNPTEDEVVKALMEVDQASNRAPAPSAPLPNVPAMQPSWTSSPATIVGFSIAMFAALGLLAWGIQRAVKGVFSSTTQAGGKTIGAGLASSTDRAQQAEAENLLARVAAGDDAAANEVLSKAPGWAGTTQPTARTDQYIGTSINLSSENARTAALQAQLALNNISIDSSGFNRLERASNNPAQRAWALWLLGALGNRGVDPDHAAKIIESYLNDPDVTVRSNAVIGLALLGTDETIPMVLDRFRNDPSPAVQELAGCGISESGMYTHRQRMTGAATLIGWLDDTLLSAQQRNWTVQALHDISGQNFGADSAAWRNWYTSQH
jgi:HEAT repeats